SEVCEPLSAPSHLSSAFATFAPKPYWCVEVEALSMQEQPEWRIEKYSDEMDPFANIQWFVMQGNIVMAQCEVETHAETILAQYQRQKTYGQALQHISAMTSDSHD